MSHNKMPKPPKGDPWSPVVNVILDTKDPKNKKFSFQSNDIEIGPNNSIVFANEDRPGFLITFRLQNPPDGYLFPENLKDALWVIDEPICPNEDNNKNWGQFKAKAVNNNGLDLVVRNLNEDKKTFGFAPRVTNDKGATYWSLDPVGTNENGGWSRQSITGYVVAAVGGAIVGSLATLGVQELLGLNPLG